MKRHEIFNVRRFLLLIRNDLFMNRVSILITAAVAAAVLILCLIYEVKYPIGPDIHMFIYFGGLFLGGFLFTMKLFSRFHGEAKGLVLQILPASPLEKLSSRLVLATVVFSVGWYMLFLIVSFGFSWFVKPVLSMNTVETYLFNKKVFLSTINFWGVQSLFLMGAVYFRKHPQLKTVLCLVAIPIFLTITLGAGQYLFFQKYLTDIDLKFILNGGIFDASALSTKEYHLENLADYFLKGGSTEVMLAYSRVGSIFKSFFVPPLLWIAAYFRIKETEV